MPLIDWNENLSVGVGEMDDQHQKWIAIINELHESLMEAKDVSSLEEIVKEMEEYTDYHFSAEEDMLEKAGYPDLGRHRRMHFGFRQEILRIKKDILGGEIVLQTQVMGIMKSWLMDHIQKADKEYGDYINKAD